MVLAASVLTVAREVGVVMAGLSLGASQDVAPVQARLSPTPVFDSGEHGDPVVSELGELSRGLILDDDRVVLLDGRNLLFINPGTGELSTTGGHGGGPGEFEGTGLELAMFRAEEGFTVWDLNNDFRLTFLSDTGELLGTRRVNLSPADFDHPVSIARLYGVFDDGSLAFVDGLSYTDGAEDGARLPEYLVEVGEGGQRRTIVEFRGGQTSTILFRHSTLLSVAGDKVAVADSVSEKTISDCDNITYMTNDQAITSLHPSSHTGTRERSKDLPGHNCSAKPWRCAVGGGFVGGAGLSG